MNKLSSIYILSMKLLFSIIFIVVSRIFAIGQNIEYSNLYTNSTFDSRNLATNLAIGSTGGGAGVSSGAATYSIPISLPPGTNGITPSLSLEYNSQMPNGSLGMGWNLSGMSFITRSNRTIYYNGDTNPVVMQNTDQFILDGQPLILKSGTYGAPNSTYGLENEDFSLITSKDTQGNGPQWFEVITKEGTKIEFGNIPSARNTGQYATVLTWAINKITYPDGNYITFSYTDHAFSTLIDEVNYTGNINTGLVPYNKIKFEYKARTVDANLSYQNNTKTISNYLLDKITITADEQKAGTYQLKYATDNINSFLKEIIQLGSDDNAYNSTIFKYGDQSSEFSTTPTQGYDNPTSITIPGDYNGDGVTDFLEARQLTTSSEYQLTIYNKEADMTASEGFYVANVTKMPISYTVVKKKEIPNSYNFMAYDFTGDGADDILMVNVSGSNPNRTLNNVRLYKTIQNYNWSSNGGLPIQLEEINISPYSGFSKIHSSGNFIFPGDFNGDGVQDVLTMLGYTGGSNYGAHLYFGNSSSTFLTAGADPNVYFSINQWPTVDRIHIMDFNGDGKSDMMLIKDNHVEILTFEGFSAKRLFYTSATSLPLNKNTLYYFGDFNGDRKSDILVKNTLNNTWKILISNGQYFFESSFAFFTTPDTDPYTGDQLAIGDYNGDGKSDIYHGHQALSSSTTHLDIYYGRGIESPTVTVVNFHRIRNSYTINLGAPPPMVGDFNGDGKTDIVNFKNIFTPLDLFYFRKDGKENYLAKVKNGLNNTTEWTYKKLTSESTYYKRGNLDAYPVNNIQLPFLSVSEFKSENGIGGNLTQQYSYEGLKLHRAGKGLLGFSKITTTNTTLGTRTIDENEYNSAYYTILPNKSSVFLTSNNSLISETILTNTLVAAGTKRFWPKTTAVTQNDALAGVTTSTSLEYDTYANVTKQTVTIPNVQTTETTTIFESFPGSIPNKPTSIKVKSTRSGEAAYETTTTFAYNTKAQLTNKVEFSGLTSSVTTTYGYNTLGNLTTTTISAPGVSNRSVSSIFDTKGRYPIENTNEMGYKSTTQYDSKWGVPTETKGIDDITTTFEYDAFGRLKKTNYPEGFSTNHTYHWDIGNNQRFYTQSATSGKPTVKTWYDMLGRETKSETEAFNSGWITQVTTYDGKGNVASSTEPYKSGESYITTTYGYDAYNRQSSINQGALGTTTLAYSYSGGKLTVTSTAPVGTTSKTTDAASMLTSATDNGGTLNYTYYSHGGLKNVVNGGVTLTINEYDAYARQKKLIDINAGTTQYEYNALGQMTKQINAKGQQTTMAYNVAGQVSQRVSVEDTTTYTYGTTNVGGEIKGQIKSVTGFDGTSTHYTYNSLGQLTQVKEVNSGDHITSYTYNNYGDLQTTTYPSGLVITNEYESKGYLKKIKRGAVELYETTGVNGRGQVTAYKKGNNKTSIINYTNGFPTKYETAGVQNLNLVWDYQKGNLTSRNDAIKSKTETFTYDNLNRLENATVSGSTAFTASYASNGNINSKTDAGTYNYHGTKINAVVRVTNPAPAPIPVLQQDITYTAFMKADKVTENGYELTYTYGADYERNKSILKQGSNTVNTRYYFAGYEKDVTNSTTRYIHYISGPAGLVATMGSSQHLG